MDEAALLPASLRQHQTISSPLIETANEYHIESDDDQQIAATSQSQPPSHQSLTEENGDNRLHQTQSPTGPFTVMMAEEHIEPSEEQPSTSEGQLPLYHPPVEENKISKYLILPEISINSANKATKNKQQTGARIVTSQQFLKALREKEKKEQLEEEKRSRKFEREKGNTERGSTKKKGGKVISKKTKISTLKTTSKKSASKTSPQATSSQTNE